MRSIKILLFASLALGCGGYEDSIIAPGAANPVDAIGETAWSPATITIKVGEQVTFRNSSNIVHNVQFDAGTNAPPADIGDFGNGSRPVTFAATGTFAYHCGIHPNMQGQVIVQP